MIYKKKLEKIGFFELDKPTISKGLNSAAVQCAKEGFHLEVRWLQHMGADIAFIVREGYSKIGNFDKVSQLQTEYPALIDPSEVTVGKFRRLTHRYEEQTSRKNKELRSIIQELLSALDSSESNENKIANYNSILKANENNIGLTRVKKYTALTSLPDKSDDTKWNKNDCAKCGADSFVGCGEFFIKMIMSH